MYIQKVNESLTPFCIHAESTIRLFLKALAFFSAINVPGKKLSEGCGFTAGQVRRKKEPGLLDWLAEPHNLILSQETSTYF